MPPACAAGQGLLHLLLLIQARARPGLLADGRVQKAAGGDGAMPVHPAAAGVHGKQQGLQGTHTDMRPGAGASPPLGARAPIPDADAAREVLTHLQGAVEVIVHFGL